MPSSNSEGSVTRWIARVKSGDDDAFTQIYQRYYPQLVGVARHKLGTMRQVADEEDVAQSAFLGLYRKIGADTGEELRNRDDLIRLLIVITVRKVSNRFGHELAQKRGGKHVDGVSAGKCAVDPHDIDVPDDVKPADEQAMLAETYESYMAALTKSELRQTAQLYLAGWSHQQIADHAGRSKRTIDRQILLIVEPWKKLAEREA